MKLKTCVHCKNEFEGRRNKKFCTITCKNSYHNEEYRQANANVYSINKILTRNRNILKDLFQVYRSSAISLEVLHSYGFKTKFHTHLFNAPSGDRYTMVYDFGFKATIDNQVQIVELDNIF